MRNLKKRSLIDGTAKSCHFISRLEVNLGSSPINWVNTKTPIGFHKGQPLNQTPETLGLQNVASAHDGACLRRHLKAIIPNSASSSRRSRWRNSIPTTTDR